MAPIVAVWVGSGSFEAVTPIFVHYGSGMPPDPYIIGKRSEKRFGPCNNITYFILALCDAYARERMMSAGMSLAHCFKLEALNLTNPVGWLLMRILKIRQGYRIGRDDLVTR